MPTEVTFFRDFNFDTFLALISCITGVAALFVGGSAYKKVQKFKKSFNDKKKFGDNGTDNSKKAGRDIVEYNCDANVLATLTAATFKTSLEQAYAVFERKTEDNLHRIIDETGRIIREQKIELGSYSKIDWINIYFENAKNSSDEYMQNVWAKVLAQELSCPGSFSYKSLDVLKNMASEDFKLFERMCSLSIEGSLLQEKINDLYKDQGLYWVNLLKLKDFNLISLENSTSTYEIEPNKKQLLFYGNEYVISLKNNSEHTIKFKLDIYLFTQFAIELSKVTTKSVSKDFVIEYAKVLKTKKRDEMVVTLHKVSLVIGNQLHYDSKDLLETVE